MLNEYLKYSCVNFNLPSFPLFLASLLVLFFFAFLSNILSFDTTIYPVCKLTDSQTLHLYVFVVVVSVVGKQTLSVRLNIFFLSFMDAGAVDGKNKNKAKINDYILHLIMVELLVI